MQLIDQKIEVDSWIKMLKLKPKKADKLANLESFRLRASWNAYFSRF